MPINILVTGGGGYLGSMMVPALLSTGYKVTVLDNFMYKQNSLGHICDDRKLEIVCDDVRNKNIVKSLLKKADIVIPLAAYVGAPLCDRDPFGATSINHDAITMMLKEVSKDQMILMPTTNSAYGSGDANNYCTEESELRPISKYAYEKVRVEEELMTHENSISFRLATVFGMSPRMRIDLLVNDFVYRAVNDKFIILFESHFKRNYIHIKDVTNVFLHAINNYNSMKNEIYNVGLSDTNLSKEELCEAIKKKIHDFVYLEATVGADPDQRNYIVSNKKIENTGFKTLYSLENGILELIKGYQMIRNNVYTNV